MKAAGNRFKNYCMIGMNGTQQTAKSSNGMSLCLRWVVQGLPRWHKKIQTAGKQTKIFNWQCRPRMDLFSFKKNKQKKPTLLRKNKGFALCIIISMILQKHFYLRSDDFLHVDFVVGSNLASVKKCTFSCKPSAPPFSDGWINSK